MRSEDFLRKVEASFGKYQPGMRSHIAMELQSAPDETYRRLYSMVMKSHEQKSPPSWATLHNIIKNAGLALGSSGFHQYEAVCEKCGRGYDLDFRSCPACGHKKRFGMVRRRGVTVQDVKDAGIETYQP